jgi:3-hydroxybutyryl-CoA dehydrogenase
VCLYRICQEALRNIAKHAGTGRARVSLIAEDDALTLVIEDDGIGFDVSTKRGVGIGLASMEERARLIQADFIVESIVEVLEVKEELFSKLDAICPQHTIFASNTSSLLPSTLAAATQRRDRFLVAHYFNPPYLMPLIEIVRGQNTSDEVVDAIYSLYKEMGKRPIICQKEALGFIANRLQLVLWREAFNIVQRGIATPQDVDLAVKNSFGRRLGMVGPFELYEYIDGYDLTLQCEKYILPDMDTSNQSYPLLLEKVEKGELGAKTGKGFYEWTPEFTKAWRKKILKGLVAFARSDKRDEI